MVNYTKLFNSIITSTIWTEDDQTRLVWITMLALADQHGEVQASIPGLARVSGVSIEAAEKAISKFLAPDQYSRTPDDEGRRIEAIDGGWVLLNHAKYRMMASKDDNKSANAIRQQRFRQKRARQLCGDDLDHCVYCGEKAIGVDHIIPSSKGGRDEQSNLVRCCHRCNNHKSSRDLVNFLNDPTLPYKLNSQTILGNAKLSQIVTLSNGKWNYVTENRDIAEADTYTEAYTQIEQKTISTSKESKTKAAIEIYNLYPKKVGKDAALKSIIKAFAKVDYETLAEAVTAFAIAKKDTDQQFIPNPATWFNQSRWEDDRSAWIDKSNKPQSTYATRRPNDTEQLEIPDA